MHVEQSLRELTEHVLLVRTVAIRCLHGVVCQLAQVEGTCIAAQRWCWDCQGLLLISVGLQADRVKLHATLVGTCMQASKHTVLFSIPSFSLHYS